MSSSSRTARGGRAIRGRVRRGGRVSRASNAQTARAEHDDGTPRACLRLRERARDRSWALQSATVTLRDVGGGRTLRVCALVHYGERGYYRGVAEAFRVEGDGRAATLVELITSRVNLVEGEGWGGDVGGEGDAPKLFRLGTELAPTREARALARAHGLEAQLDVLDARQEGWFVADVTREELIALREEAGEIPVASGSGRSASPTRTLPPALEALAVTAFGRAGARDPARLFTRLGCWLVPCPEAHLLLLDWVWAGGRPSEVLGALVDCCASGDLLGARRLAFAQMIVSAQARGPAGGGADEPILVARRNDVAIDGVAKAFKANVRSVNLLYGGLHAPGLIECARERLNMEVVDVEWRDAWRVRPPANASPLRYVIVPLLLGVDGTDWAQSLHDVVVLSAGGGLVSTLLYIVRHAALYYALGKWLLEWNRQLFDADLGPSPKSVDARAL